MPLLKAIINISTDKEIYDYTFARLEKDLKFALERFCFLNQLEIKDVRVERVL